MSDHVDFVLDGEKGAKVRGRVEIGSNSVVVKNEQGAVARLVTVEEVASATFPEPVAAQDAAPEAPAATAAPATAPEV